MENSENHQNGGKHIDREFRDIGDRHLFGGEGIFLGGDLTRLGASEGSTFEAPSEPCMETGFS